MTRETQRRLVLLAVVGVVAVVWAAGFTGTRVTALASAAAVPPSTSVARFAPCPFPVALRTAFEDAARDAAIPPGMLWAVAKVESNLHPDAESAAGARGLLQVMPATARSLDLNVDEPRSKRFIHVTNPSWSAIVGATKGIDNVFGVPHDAAHMSKNPSHSSARTPGRCPSSETARAKVSMRMRWLTR